MRIRTGGTSARSIDSIGWALFFMWVGIALLANLGWTVSLIGTAVIILVVQGLLYLRGERMDVFMAAVGVVLLIGAVADIYGSVWTLFPALLIVIGIAMLADTLRGSPRDQRVTARGREEERPV